MIIKLEESQQDQIRGTPTIVAQENGHQLSANIMQQLSDTEVLEEQLHMLTPNQLASKDKLLKQMEHTIRFRLPILKDSPKRNLA